MQINPTYLLRQPKSSTPTAIVLQFFVGGKRFKWSTRLKVFPELWNTENQRPISTKGVTNAERQKVKRLIAKYEINHPTIKLYLENVDARIEHINSLLTKYLSRYAKSDEVLDLEGLRKELDSQYQVKAKEVQPKASTLNGYIDLFIKGIKNGTITIDSGKRKGRKYAKGSVKSFEGFKVQFDAYQKAKHRKFQFEDCTVDLYNDLITYFNGKGYSANSTGKQIKHLKTILRRSREEGYHNNREWERSAIKVLKAATQDVYLTEKEIRRLLNYDLSDKPHLAKIRDVFLIGCFTALRFSDYKRIRPEHIKDHQTDEGIIKVIDIITSKEQQRVIIPMRPELQSLLSKYDNHVPRTYEQKINKGIKTIAELAKIDTPIEIERIKGGLKVKRTVPKHDLIKTHTARRTGATLMYKGGIPSIDIMKLTGHTTESNFLKYIKVTNEETALRLAKHPFFNQVKASV